MLEIQLEATESKYGLYGFGSQRRVCFKTKKCHGSDETTPMRVHEAEGTMDEVSKEFYHSQEIRGRATGGTGGAWCPGAMRRVRGHPCHCGRGGGGKVMTSAVLACTTRKS